MQANPDTIHYAVITFLAEDNSHGYAKIAKSMEELSSHNFFNQVRHNGYKFHPNGRSLSKYQVISLKPILNSHPQKADVIDTTLLGVKNSDSSLLILDKASAQLLLTIAPLSLPKQAMYTLHELTLLRQKSADFTITSLTEITPSKAQLDTIAAKLANLIDNYSRYNANLINNHLQLLLKADKRYLDAIEQSLLARIAAFEQSPDPALGESFMEILKANGFEHWLGFDTYNSLIGGNLPMFDQWLVSELPPDLAVSEEFSELITNPTFIQTLNWLQIQALFEKLETKAIYDEIFMLVIDAHAEESKAQDLLGFVDKSTQPKVFTRQIYQRLPAQWVVTQWLDDNLLAPPTDSQIMEVFAQLEASQRQALLQQSTLEQYAKYAENLCESDADVLGLYLQKLPNKIGEQLHYCAFDLEVNPQTHAIEQLAYETPQGKQNYWKPSITEVEELVAVIEQADLVVGHNIRAFDLLQLMPEEIAKGLPIWDTLEVALFLSPTADSLALKTPHEAVADTTASLQVFAFQWLCLHLSQSPNTRFIEQCLPQKVAQGFAWPQQWLPSFELALLHTKQQELFHWFDHSLTKKLRAELPTEAQLLVMPVAWWHHWALATDVHFVDNALPTYKQVLDSTKVQQVLHDFPLLRNALLRYIDTCETKGQLPYARLLGKYAQLKINEVTDLTQLSHPIAEGFLSTGINICSVWYFAQHSQALLNTYKAHQVVLLDVDLWQCLVGRQVKTFDRQTLYQQSTLPQLWARFANGVSTTSLDKTEAKTLAGSLPLAGNWFWLRRSSANHFELWEGWQGVVEHQATFAKHSIASTLHQPLTDPEQLVYLSMANPQEGQFVTFNPETFYRDKYWEQRLQWLYGLWANNHFDQYSLHAPYVLLINQQDEAETLTDILTKLGAYVPKPSVGLRRKMELVASRKQGIVIAHVSQLDQALSYPQTTAFTYLLESLMLGNLTHLMHTLKEQSTMAASEATEEEDGLDEVVELANEVNLPQETNTQISKYYDWIFSRILWQHPQNHLVILDPRARAKTFYHYRAKALVIDPNSAAPQASQYEAIGKMCKARFDAPRSFEFNEPFDVYLQRMAAVFLKGKGDNGQTASFKENQKDYLKLIFPAKQDVLVTLPTGEGKSILFQAPSLYRGSFSNKLTIVVTPLKALMEDHAIGLWKLGFWNAVDFINHDKGWLGVQDIYRRMAGGELSLVFVTPERFRSNSFIHAIATRLDANQGFEYVVFDEAHCISQWGNEFRPDYFYCVNQVKELRKGHQTPLLLLSATITQQVAQHLKNVLYN